MTSFVDKEKMNLAERTQKIHHELYGKVRMEGQLEKWPVNKLFRPGKERRWKTRYFVVADNLAYYETEEDYKSSKKPKGVICLDFAALALHSTDKCKVTLRTAKEMLVLRTASEDEAQTWLKALKRAQLRE